MHDQDWIWPNMRAAFFEDLAKVHDRTGSIDVVLFTGDLTQRGSKEEFEKLGTTLADLWEHLEKLGSRPVLLAVPGNHDLVRPNADNPTVRALAHWETDAVVRDGFWEGSEYQKLISRVFAPYTDFWNKTPHRPRSGIKAGLLPGDFSYVLEKEGARFGFLGMSSTFLQLTGEDYERKLVVHPRQAQPAVDHDLSRWAEACDACFLLTHHPPEWLQSDSQDVLKSEILVPDRFVAHLFGHMHESRVTTLAEGGAGARRAWQGCSLFGIEKLKSKDGKESKIDRRHGYAVGQLTLGGPSASVRLWPRRAERGHSGTWHIGPDTFFRLQDDVAYVNETVSLPTRSGRPAAAAAPAGSAAPSASPIAVVVSAASRHPARTTTNPWAAAAMGCRLWSLLEPGKSAEQWRTAVERLVDGCWSIWAVAGAKLEDPWRDEDLPPRVLRMLDLLALEADPLVTLHPPEVALAVVAPFVREAAFAAGASWMAGGDPLSLDVKGQSKGPRAALEREHESRAPLVRKAKRLKEQGRKADHCAVALWMMNQCLFREPALWEIEPHGYLPPTLRRAIEHAGEVNGAVRATFVWPRLRELSRCVLGAPERIDREDGEDRLREEEVVSGAGSVREKLLGYLLCLAGWMATDVRRFPELVVEHIGLTDPLSPANLTGALRTAVWRRIMHGRSLEVTCDHPALDHALRVTAEQAESVLGRIHRGAEERRARLEALRGLPGRLTAEHVKPARTEEDRPVYRTPHIRFELAHDEVKELLMGKELYGDPTLAIREMYQNALDACRYRRARTAYLRQTGRPCVEPWEGEIQFRQDEENGRPYIECEDNGVGMGLTELEGCFAKAGRRFHDMPEFLEEQTQWLRVEPAIRLYPNSQFGIGVFSYFMLADEIEVETCRFNRDGSLGRVIRAHISGSGSLFRVQVGDPGARAGTRVRLYLSRETYEIEESPTRTISCQDALLQVLAVVEFQTSCSESGEGIFFWKVGELYGPWQLGALEIAENLWCVKSRRSYVDAGRILSDGIVTESTHPSLIVNLTGPRRPRLSVDRKTVIEWDSTWLEDAIRPNKQRLVEWTNISISFLWWLDSQFPRVAASCFADLISRDQKILSSGVGGRTEQILFVPAQVPIGLVGCLGMDANILRTPGALPTRDEPSRTQREQERWRRRLGLTDAWDDPDSHLVLRRIVIARLAAWSTAGVQFDAHTTEIVASHHSPTTSGAACVPAAGDIVALKHGYSISPGALVLAALQLGETAAQIYLRMQKYVSIGCRPANRGRKRPCGLPGRSGGCLVSIQRSGWQTSVSVRRGLRDARSDGRASVRRAH